MRFAASTVQLQDEFVETRITGVGSPTVITTEGAKHQSALSNRDCVRKPWVGIAVGNTFNHPNFGNPASNISVPGSAGVISTTRPFGGARQIMLRGRLDF